MKTTLAALAGILLLSGCSAYERINRLEVDLKENVRDGRMEDAAAIENRILEISQESYGPGSHDDVWVRTDLAENWARWRHADKALGMARETIAQLEQMFGPDDEELAGAWLSLARIHYILRQWDETEDALDRASAICRRIYDTTPPGTFRFTPCFEEAPLELPAHYLSIGAYEKWADAYLFEEERDPGDRGSAIRKIGILGLGYAGEGAYPEATWYLQRCVDELAPHYERYDLPAGTVWRSPEGDVEVLVVDSAHSFTSQSPVCLENLIEVKRKTGEDAVADELERWQRELWSRGPELEEQLRRKVAFSDRTWGKDYNTTMDAHSLAFYLANKGRTEEAIRAYEEALGYIDRALEREGVFAGTYPAWLHLDELLDLGPLLEQVGRFADAEQTYLRAVAISAAEIQPYHAWNLDSLAGLARSRLGLGRLADAEATWRRYLDVAESIRGTDHADYAFGLAGLAEVQEAGGRRADAARSRRQAASIRAAYARRVESVGDLPLPPSLRSSPSPAN